MIRRLTSALVLGMLSAIPFQLSAATGTTTHELYLQHCGECHSVDRLGAIGPALLPENLKRLKKKRAAGVIANGRIATQMPP
ncbi:MAG: cytochrome c, partial [Sedimenticola sp.]